MSYDDGRVADRRLVSIFNKNGIKGTFHLNAGLMERGDHITADEAKELYVGHEISCHTFTHPTIARCPNELIIQQVMEDRKKLEDIAGYPVRGLSYPNGSHDKRIRELLPFCGIEYSRTVGGTGGYSIPEDFLAWTATCHHRDCMKYAQAFVELHKRQYLYMLYVWGHSYEFDNNNNWELIEQFCEFIGKRDDIWYATNIEIVDYLKACNNLKYSASCDFVYNPSVQTVWLEVDGKIVEVKGGTQVNFNTLEQSEVK